MVADPLTPLGPDSIVGSYRLVREIGAGGMGTVYEAVHTVLSRRAAVKVMHANLRNQPSMIERMVQEGTVLDDIRHPGIVRIYECNLLPDHRPWLAMELVEGETLTSRLTRGPMAPSELAALLGDVADVLASVHRRGVVHRDLKPDNLLLTPNDRDCPLRVIDWGVARLGASGRLTANGMTPGTPLYMAPEQATGKEIGAPCDIYSLGVIAYEVLSGHVPFDGRSLVELVAMHLTAEPRSLHGRTAASDAFCDLVHRMLSKDPATRPTAAQVREAARAHVRELSGDAYEELTVTHELGPRLPPATIVPTEDVEIVDIELDHVNVTQPYRAPRSMREALERAATVLTSE